MMNRFEGKVALVTGSSQGIGAACAIRLAREGADVILNGRTLDERGSALIDQVTKMGRRATFIAADIRVAQNVVKLVNDAVTAFGQLDILVNNAGVEKNRDFWEVTEEEYDFVMDINLKGVFF
jgi:glucose 1-dehydrogenase